MDFSDKNVIVTGAGSGIGRATAELFAKKGARVAVADRNIDGAREVVEAIAGSGGNALAVECDVTSKQNITERFGELLAEWGQVHALVNNAGGGLPGTIEDIEEDVWDALFKLNVNSVLLCSQALVPSMKEAKYGRIVNVASLAGRSKSVLAGLHYGSSKAAVLGLTRNLAYDLGPFGVTVNAICPGPIATPLTAGMLEQREEHLQLIPLRRWGAAEDCAGAILFLASDYASYITGVALDINGGQFMA